MEAGLNLADDLAGLLKRLFRNDANLRADLFYFFLCNDACIQKLAGKETTDGRMGIDF